MMLVGECKKCGTTIKLDIEDNTVEETVKKLSDWTGFQCPGHHCEISPPYPHYWKIDEWELVDGSALDEDTWLNNLKEKVGEVFDTEQLSTNFKSIGFSMGMCTARRKSDNETVIFDWKQSPVGKRYYYAI